MANKCNRGLSGNLPGNLVFGVPGKSAYEYAVEAGYTGTEEEFAEQLAQQGGAVDEATVQKIVDDYLAENPPAQFEPDEDTLVLERGTLSVKTTNEVIKDDPRPITSGAVYDVFSKAVALLKTI